MIEPILEYSSFVSFHNLVCSPSHNGAYPLLREHQAFHRLHSPLDLVVDPSKLSYRGISPSPRASDLPHALFTFQSSCWPLRVAYWGIPSFPGIIGPFIGFIIFGPSSRSSWVVILGHIPSDWVCLHHHLSYPMVLGHLIRSFLLSVCVQFESGPHL